MFCFVIYFCFVWVFVWFGLKCKTDNTDVSRQLRQDFVLAKVWKVCPRWKGFFRYDPQFFSWFVWGCIFICSWTKKRICWEIWPPVMCIWDVCGIGCQPDIAVRCRRRYTDLYSIFRLPQFLGLCHCHFALIHHHDSTYLARQDDVVTDADVDNILQNDHSIFVKPFLFLFTFGVITNLGAACTDRWYQVPFWEKAYYSNVHFFMFLLTSKYLLSFHQSFHIKKTFPLKTRESRWIC